MSSGIMGRHSRQKDSIIESALPPAEMQSAYSTAPNDMVELSNLITLEMLINKRKNRNEKQWKTMKTTPIILFIIKILTNDMQWFFVVFFFTFFNRKKNKGRPVQIV